MTTRQTPVREAEAREFLANAMGSKHWASLVREGKDDDWGVIKVREAIAAILAALNSRAGDAGEGFKWPEPKFVPVDSGAKLNPERVEAAFQLINGELVIGEQFQLIGMMLDGTDYTVVPATSAPAVEAECPSSHDGRHQVDTSMESGPNNCFHCEVPMGGKA